MLSDSRIAVLGCLAFLLGEAGIAFHVYERLSATKEAGWPTSQTTDWQMQSNEESKDCRNVDLNGSALVMRPVVGETILIRVKARSRGTIECRMRINLHAAGFDKDPKEVLITAGPTDPPLDFPWSLAAKQPGRHEVVLLSANESVAFQFNVQSNVLLGTYATSIASVAAATLGPMATLPWWISFYREHRARAKKRRPQIPKVARR